MSIEMLAIILIVAGAVGAFFFALAKAAKMGEEAERRWRQELERIQRRDDDDDTKTWPPGAVA